AAGRVDQIERQDEGPDHGAPVQQHGAVAGTEVVDTAEPAGALLTKMGEGSRCLAEVHGLRVRHIVVSGCRETHTDIGVFTVHSLDHAADTQHLAAPVDGEHSGNAHNTLVSVQRYLEETVAHIDLHQPAFVDPGFLFGRQRYSADAAHPRIREMPHRRPQASGAYHGVGVDADDEFLGEVLDPHIEGD